MSVRLKPDKFLIFDIDDVDRIMPKIITNQIFRKLVHFKCSRNLMVLN